MCLVSSFVNFYTCEIGKQYIILLGRFPKENVFFFIKKKFSLWKLLLYWDFFSYKKIVDICLFWIWLKWVVLILEKNCCFSFFIFILLFCFDGFVSLSIYLVVTCNLVSPHKKTKNHLRERERDMTFLKVCE